MRARENLAVWTGIVLLASLLLTAPRCIPPQACTVDGECDDGIACTADTCDPAAGSCVYTPQDVLCDDGNACTTDTCGPITGCRYADNTDPCDDGDGCTGQDACEAGECVGGPPPQEGPPGDDTCSDGIDNDCDGQADGLDTGCQEDPGGAILIDHACTDIARIPQSAIQAARSLLHIGYGHTSHGSQLTEGMTGLVAFANGGGKGLSLPPGIFAWNNGGTGGALDLEEGNGGWLEQDCGYYPQWVNETREYLNAPSHADVNVIVWSWCGQVSGKYAAGTLASQYLTPMAQLEAQYPGVTFVYMTGHVDHWDDANNKAANQAIRDFCQANGKVLYDFADIESHDPDGTFYAYPGDNCDYYASAGSGVPLGNWATAWQASHTEGVDWYDCYAAHSQPLNANLKAYAAWWLWARLAGWDGVSP